MLKETHDFDLQISAEVLLLLIPLLSNIISRIWERISLIKGVPESESVSENFTITVLFVTRDVAAAIQGQQYLCYQ